MALSGLKSGDLNRRHHFNEYVKEELRSMRASDVAQWVLEKLREADSYSRRLCLR